MLFFGYTIADFIPCEIRGCGKRAVDTHHIKARSIAKALFDDIKNLMALCREHHTQYGDKKQHRQFLIDTHNEFMQKNGKGI